jgi:hypothetical protein
MLGPMLVAFFVAVALLLRRFRRALRLPGPAVRPRALRDWRIEARRGASIFGPLAEPGFLPLLAVIVCYASAFGLVEIATTAFAAEKDAPALAGVLLSVMSVGSAAGGLVYGSRSWHLPLARQFPLMLILMGLGIAPLALLAGAWPFGAWCVIAGIAMAPALIMQSMLVANCQPSIPRRPSPGRPPGCSRVGLGLTGDGLLLQHARAPAVFAAAAALSVLAGAGDAPEGRKARRQASGACCRGAFPAPRAPGRRACRRARRAT